MKERKVIRRVDVKKVRFEVMHPSVTKTLVDSVASFLPKVKRDRTFARRKEYQGVRLSTFLAFFSPNNFYQSLPSSIRIVSKLQKICSFRVFLGS